MKAVPTIAAVALTCCLLAPGTLFAKGAGSGGHGGGGHSGSGHSGGGHSSAGHGGGGHGGGGRAASGGHAGNGQAGRAGHSGCAPHSSARGELPFGGALASGPQARRRTGLPPLASASGLLRSRTLPYGFGRTVTGLGVFFSPFSFWPGYGIGYDDVDGSAFEYGMTFPFGTDFGYGMTYPFDDFGDDGRLRLEVKPNNAQVFVDGYYAGVVDDFDGIFQHLTLAPGSHHVEVRANGFEPLAFDVAIRPDHKTTYRGALKPSQR